MKIKSIVLKVILPAFAIITIITGFKLLSPKTLNTNASYSLFPTFSSILDESDTIIIGKVVNVDKGFAIDKNNYIVGEKAKEIIKLRGKHLYVYTPCKIKVEKVLKGDMSTNNMIRINQEGGTYENTYYNIDGNKIYKNNQSYVFFLRKGDISTEQTKKDFKEEFYLPINPFQGQLLIEKNTIQFDKKFNCMFDSDSINLDKLIELIRSHIDNTL